MKKILRTIGTVVMILSLLLNLMLLMSIGYISIEYEDSYYIETLEWCEYSNDLSDLVNELLYDLEYYDDDYSKVKRLEILDCFSNEELEVENEITN